MYNLKGKEDIPYSIKTIMKKIIITCGVLIMTGVINAQNLNRDSLSMAAAKMYESILPLLNKVEFSGNSKASQEVRERWNNVITQLKNKQGTMAKDVKDLLVSPSGTPIDMELLKKIIQITEKDSTKKVNINMDFIFNEIKAATEKVTDAAKKIAEIK